MDEKNLGGGSAARPRAELARFAAVMAALVLAAGGLLYFPTLPTPGRPGSWAWPPAELPSLRQRNTERPQEAGRNLLPVDPQAQREVATLEDLRGRLLPRQEDRPPPGELLRRDDRAEAGRGDAGQGAHLVEQSLVEALAFGGGVALDRQVDLAQHQLVGPRDRIGQQRPPRGFDHGSGSRQERQREPDLAGNQQAAQARPALAGSRQSSFEERDQVDARGLPCRGGGVEQRRTEGEEQGEEHHPEIQLHLHAAHRVGGLLDRRRRARQRRREPEQRNEQRQQGAFRQIRAQQPPAAGAQSDAQRRLPPPRDSARQQQVRDVGAGDELEQADAQQQQAEEAAQLGALVGEEGSSSIFSSR